MVEPAGRPGDPAGQVEVEDEVLTEPFARDNAVPSDDLAQRRGGWGVVRQAALSRRAAI
jgi:hypothetical protein